MQITINDEIMDCPVHLTVSRLLERLKINEDHVAVELNCNVIPRAKFREKMLREYDKLEIVTFVGGG